MAEKISLRTPIKKYDYIYQDYFEIWKEINEIKTLKKVIEKLYDLETRLEQLEKL